MQRTSLPLEFWFFVLQWNVALLSLSLPPSRFLSLLNRLDLFGNNFVIDFGVCAERQSFKISKYRLLANNKHHWLE